MANDPLKNSPKKPLNNYIRYSSMGLQMGMSIFCMAWAGVKLDRYFELTFPAFTLVLTLASVVGVMYYFIKQVSKK
jgi:ATP synthase protein I